MNYAVCFLPLIRIFVDLVKEMWQAILGKIMNPINILIWLPWCFNVINNNWLLRTLFGCSVLRMTPPCLRFVFVQPLCSSCRLRHDFHYHVPHPDQWSVVQLISSSHRAPIWKKITDLVILSWQSSRQSFNISWAHNVFSSDSWKKNRLLILFNNLHISGRISSEVIFILKLPHQGIRWRSINPTVKN